MGRFFIWSIFKVLRRKKRYFSFADHVMSSFQKGIKNGSSIEPEKEVAMTNTNQPRFGFVNFAETWNGRLAMAGILIGLGTELLTGQGILGQIGFG